MTAHRDAASSGRGKGGRPGSRASLGGGRAEAERLDEEGTRGARRWETQSSRAGEKWSAVRGAARLKEGGARGKERAEARPRLLEDACFGRLFVSCDAGGFCAKRGRQKLPRICVFGRGFCFCQPEAAQNLNQTGAIESKDCKLGRTKIKHMRWAFDTATHEEEGVNLEDQVVPKKDTFRYLGSMLQRDNNIDEDVSYRIKARWMMWRQTFGALCDKSVPQKLKRQVLYVHGTVVML